MGLVTTKRLQQGIFEALATMNRAAGSGGGGGFAPFILAGTTGSIPSAGGLTAPSSPRVITGGLTTFQVNRPQYVLVMGTINAGTNAAAGSINLMQLTATNTLTLTDGSTFPYGVLTGIGAGTINYVPVTLFMVLFAQPGSYSAWWQLNAVSTGSVSVQNGNLDVFYLGG